MKVSNNQNPNLAKADLGKTKKTDGLTPNALDSKLNALNNDKQMRDTSRVDVSERAQLMQKAKDIASKQTVDEAKVARLQKLIDDGKYKVDADAVADRLIDTHMDFPD